MSLRGVVRILRLPLFLTAVADSVAGYTVALFSHDIHRFDWPTVGLLAGASTGLYLFGMVQNDLVDIRRDRLLGIPRPLVTGQIRPATAGVLLILTAALAAVCAVRLSGGALLVAIGAFGIISLYNLGAKQGPAYVAMSVMGLARLANFGMGVAAGIGVPHHLGAEMFSPVGPLWVRHGLALFAITWIVTGYSICARLGQTVSTRPWRMVFFVGVGMGVLVVAWKLLLPAVQNGGAAITPPVLRVLAIVLLAGLWPGGLWSVAGPDRKPAEYAPFIERALYWIIAMDAAFVLDALMR
jgi:hypothetical protein